jgi:hypothetical protein
MNKKNIIKIHKIEVARRQLETAINLFFTNGDVFAIITLAGAAEEIFGVFLKREDMCNMYYHLEELSKRKFGERDSKIVNNEINGIRNNLKHANDPTEDMVELLEEYDALGMLMRAIVNYSRLNNGDTTPDMLRVIEYISTQYPELS